MLKTYTIVSGDTQTSCGILIYDTEKDTYTVQIDPEHDSSDMPAIMAICAERDKYTLSGKEALRLVRSRVIPPDRQNIDQILEKIGSAYYSELAILEYTGGRCCRDNFYIERV